MRAYNLKNEKGQSYITAADANLNFTNSVEFS